MSLREKALRAYQLEQTRTEQEKAVLHATQTERTAKAFREMFGVEPDGVTINDILPCGAGRRGDLVWAAYDHVSYSVWGEGG
jgi:hypothetical protein